MGRPLQAGLTLLEMMAALAIAAVGVCLALPMLGQQMERQRLRGHAMALMGSLEHARAEALRLNRPVYLCAANLKVNRELQGCLPRQAGSSQSWPEGVLVYADQGAANAYYDGGERLRLAMFDGDRVAVRAEERQLALTAEGRLQSSRPVRFVLSGRSQCLALTVAANGRAKLAEVGDACA
ncbi:GspH/FimT family pseudopilin [Chromobacterium violaceum]|uniref:GspH/FimT family pseudopilin n=1 Tax=Chromobacterium violaceum TaxID=536 RepID=UPI001B33011F|nr:GspH/FimT family pseudopilin [Chromobacterium violaceum]MBP4044593.1 GspH/FimT family pseudopilin [Chromobacterium violaceum]